jgi:acyl CoA:acetate/3-ketoacid CoA transferase alpha subunit
MRDSTGAVAPVVVTSYDAAGVPIDIPFELFVLDTMLRAHFTLTHLLIGDKLGNVTVVGQASGVQTLTANVPVTVRPTTLLLDPKPDTLFAPLGTDSASSTKNEKLSTIVKGAGDTTVQGVIVHYRLTRTLNSSSSTTPAVYISDALGKPMNADTTAPQGVADKRYVTVLTRLLTDQALISGQKADSVVVEATASYKGAPLTGSPLTIVIPIKVTISIR